MIADERCILLIGELANQRVGMVRFDLSNDQKGTGLRGLVNINIAPDVRGRGYGKILLEDAINDLGSGVSLLEAVVLDTNWSSRRLFESLDFKPIKQTENLISYERLVIDDLKDR